MIVQGNPVMRFTYASGARPLDGYTIKRGIGIGGFGEVYFAISDAGKEVAIKRIQRNLEIELRGVRQCLNMKHANLIALWDIRTTEHGETWVVMEYVPGYSLRDVLANHPQGMNEAQVRLWITSIAAGVGYLHERGIVHRDLKPGNVFFDTDSQVVKIGDYGLSKFISGSRRSGHTESVGTFHYMAPEIGRGSYGKEIDLYALGVMFYEMLCGQPPFDGETTHEIIMKHLTAEPDLSRIPVRFHRVIERCLRKDPSERYANVAEMMADTPWGLPGDEAAAAPLIRPSIHITPNEVSPDEPTRWQIADHEVRPAKTEEPVIIDERSAAEAERLVERIRSGLESGERDPVVLMGGQPAGVYGGGDRRSNLWPREPIARFVYHSAHDLAAWWKRLDWTTPWKIFALLAVALVLLGNLSWLLPAALGLGVLYAIYFGVRALFVQETPALPTTVCRPRATENDLRLMVARRMDDRDWAEQGAEVVGGLFKAALVCAVFSAIIVALHGFSIHPESLAVALWVTMTSSLVAWTALVTTRFWSWPASDRLFRLLIMTMVGAVLGLLSYGLWLHLLPEPQTWNFDGWSREAMGTMNSVHAIPRLLAAMGLWFGIVRWWRLADPWRRNRIVIRRLAVGVVLAVGVGYVFGFESWFPWVGGAALVAVQLAAPWHYPELKLLQGNPSRLVAEKMGR